MSAEFPITDLGTLGGAHSGAVAINDRGQVAGGSTTATGEGHAFLWRKGTMTDLGTLGGRSSSAVAINNRGQVVGTSATTNGSSPFGTGPHAFRWQKGTMTNLGDLGQRISTASAINDHGQVVGTFSFPGYAFLWQNGTMTDLGTLGVSPPPPLPSTIVVKWSAPAIQPATVPMPSGGRTEG
jgi:probable HAF family extracellular repeat protein